jgi:hypothetical protein
MVSLVLLSQVQRRITPRALTHPVAAGDDESPAAARVLWVADEPLALLACALERLDQPLPAGLDVTLRDLCPTLALAPELVRVDLPVVDRERAGSDVGRKRGGVREHRSSKEGREARGEQRRVELEGEVGRGRSRRGLARVLALRRLPVGLDRLDMQARTPAHWRRRRLRRQRLRREVGALWPVGDEGDAVLLEHVVLYGRPESDRQDSKLGIRLAQDGAASCAGLADADRWSAGGEVAFL